ncbi:MAG: hypothetical protein AVO35_07720 [Candidatus Aegiribacteria sp. MLS_C]|nr:MAG: hypothetical protein AVO35_07720 [Candidatus Aegiribacteria sp. MLS_C]
MNKDFLLLIDADDTLWESALFFVRAEEDFLGLMTALGAPLEEVRRTVHRKDIERLSVTGYGAGPYMNTLSSVMHEFVPAPPEWSLVALEDIRRCLIGHPVVVAPGVHDTLAEISAMSFRSVVYTMGEEGHQKDKFLRSGLGSEVDELAIVPEKTVDSLIELLHRTGYGPERTVLVGNSPRSDINPATSLGLFAVYLRRDLTWAAEHQELAHPELVAEIRRFDELPGLLRKFSGRLGVEMVPAEPGMVPAEPGIVRMSEEQDGMPQVNLLDALDPGLIEYRTDLSGKEGVLRRIAVLAAGSGKTGAAVEDRIFDALMERESLGSTGFGHGVAIPHCRTGSMETFMAGLLVSSEGIDFDSIDGERVRIFPFVIGPESEPRVYLRLLASIAQIFRHEDTRKAILSLRDPEEVRRLLREQASPKDETPPRRPGMKMMHVFVQNEEIFDDILQVFTGSDSISAMVLEARESTDYLMKGPFFDGFWDSKVQRFSRLIVAVVRDELVNSAVRSIEYVCGRLSDRDDIMVTVTDLRCTLGSLGL